MIDVRDLDPDDWRAWRDLRLAALADSPAAFRTTHAYWSGPGDTETNWRDRLAGRPLNAVLSLDGRAAAMVSAGPAGDGSAVELHSMWVAPFARGSGVGDAAIRHVVAWAAHAHPGLPVELGVMDRNEAATRLYRRHGFSDAGPDPDHPGERLMRRPPSAAATPGAEGNTVE